MKNVEPGKRVARVVFRPSFDRWISFVPFVLPLALLRQSRKLAKNHAGTNHEKT
jgi:hypothetical protein